MKIPSFSDFKAQLDIEPQHMTLKMR